MGQTPRRRKVFREQTIPSLAFLAPGMPGLLGACC